MYPDNRRIGFSAVSPSGKRIATMNLKDGVDFYSTSHKTFIMSTQSPRSAPQGIATQITFVDDDTVAVGHSGGTIYFATFGMGQSIVTFSLTQETETREITCELALPFAICTYRALVTNSRACPMCCQSKFIHSGRRMHILIPSTHRHRDHHTDSTSSLVSYQLQQAQGTRHSHLLLLLEPLRTNGNFTTGDS